MKNSNDASPRQPKEIGCVALLTACAVTAPAAAQTDFANKRACDFGARRMASLSFTSLNQAVLKIATRHAM
jgi:hypothetical protein